MKKEKLDLIYKALFYNIGRLVSRSQGRSDGEPAEGKDWLQNCLPQLNLENNEKIAKIIALADSIVRGLPEQKQVSDGQFSQPLADIFNRFKAKKEGLRYQKFEFLTDDSEFSIASQEITSISQSDYQELLEQLIRKLCDISLEEESLPALFNIWQSLFSTVPLLPSDKELGDISLAEHSQLTAGFAAAIYDYLEDSGQEHLLDDLPTFDGIRSFLLASFDLSGIQDFIYNIASKGAAKQLKARSLYLDLMSGAYCRQSFGRVGSVPSQCPLCWGWTCLFHLGQHRANHWSASEI